MPMYVYDVIFLIGGAVLLYVLHAGSHAVGHGEDDRGGPEHPHAHGGPSYLQIFSALVTLTLIELGTPRVLDEAAGGLDALPYGFYKLVRAARRKGQVATKGWYALRFLVAGLATRLGRWSSPLR